MADSHVKIFKKSRRGVALHFAKGIGDLSIKEGTIPYVQLGDGKHKITRLLVRQQSLGKKTTYILLVVGFKYEKDPYVLIEQKATKGQADGDVKEDQASVDITLTNEPPNGSDPVDIDIVATDEDPSTEENESPELPDDDVLVNT
ncbi:hypothetical protein [Paludisphaera rhizosphaerae]|uniref:hypothetical protein n=1 Tax=Paludisphaera rhizosphaerae TaxID=2711216 RepID=UPI0013EC40B0|nr:hypothetical protein [Paludisphaera rhizosphaerae]